MQPEPGEVQHTVRQLKQRHLISVREGARAGVEKFSQRLCNTVMAKLQFTPPDFVVVTLPLLRGPQTPGELRAHAGRLHSF